MSFLPHPLFAFYSYKLLRTIAFIISHTFIPVFLFLQVGYSLLEVSLFTTIVHGIMIPFIPFTEKVIEKIGVKRTISLHVFGMGLFFYLLPFLSGNFFLDLPYIFLLGCIKSIPKAFFSAAETLFVSQEILKVDTKDGKNLSYIEITLLSASILSPLVGGAITYFYGFTDFFTAIALLSFVSGIPLWINKDIYIPSKNTYKEIITFTICKMDRNFQIAEFGKNFSDSVIQILWAIFILLVVENTLEMGTLLSLSSAIGIVISYVIGKKIDEGRYKNIVSYMTKFVSAIFFIRIFFPHPIALLLTDSISKISSPLLKIPYDKHLYSYIKSFTDSVFGSVAYVLYFEFIYLFGFVGVSVYLWMVEIFQIEISYIVFIPIFVIYGLTILCMQRIVLVKNH